MTQDELVEIGARGICRRIIARNIELDSKPRDASFMQTAEDVGWQYWVAEAEAVLSALSSRGLAVVPVEPTEAMVERGAAEVAGLFGSDDNPASTSHNAYAAMLSAALPKEGQ